MGNGLQPPIPAGAALHFGNFDLSVPDVTVVVLMVIVFALALFIPFPGGGKK